MLRSAAACLVLVACNPVFGITPTIALDATVEELDTDGDGVPDLTDNCRDVPNPDQSDEDQDGVGDACDNCPLVANTSQDNVGDHDAVGDACDPRPTMDGDCLVLLDSFVDPTAFAQNWTILPATAGPQATAEPGDIRLVPTGGSIGVLANGFPSLADLEIKAKATLAVGGDLIAVASATSNIGPDPYRGYGCDLQAANVVSEVYVGGAGDEAFSIPLSAPAVTDTILIRLTFPDTTATMPSIECRADYGVAVGDSPLTPSATPAPGGVGVVAVRTTVEIDAIAIYEQLTPCPTPIVR